MQMLPRTDRYLIKIISQYWGLVMMSFPANPFRDDYGHWWVFPLEMTIAIRVWDGASTICSVSFTCSFKSRRVWVEETITSFSPRILRCRWLRLTQLSAALRSKTLLFSVEAVRFSAGVVVVVMVVVVTVVLALWYNNISYIIVKEMLLITMTGK